MRLAIDDFRCALFTMALVSLWVVSPAHAKRMPPGEEKCWPCSSEPGARLCAQLSQKGIERGEKATWHLRIEGSEKPVFVRIFNLNPRVVQVKNGLLLETSGGAKNRVKSKLKGLGIGASPLHVRCYAEDPRVEQKNVASVFENPVAKILETVSKVADERGGLSPKAVKARLANVERRLTGMLDELEETQPLADWVRFRFREVYAALGLEGEAVPEVSVARKDSPPRIARAAWPPPREARSAWQLTRGKDEAGMSRALDLAAGIVRQLLDLFEESDLVTELCVASEPDRARYAMHPPSYPDQPKETETVGRFETVYRGLYSYRIGKRGHKTIRCLPRLDKPGKRIGCAPLDLVDDSRPVFACSFENRTCKRESEIPEGCR